MSGTTESSGWREPVPNIQSFFGLSYNHYLVVPRSLLQSMPAEWQAELVRLLTTMINTPGGEKFAEAHYYVQRTDPDRDQEISEAEIFNRTHDHAEEEREVPEVKVIDDPFFNYRHPDRSLFALPDSSAPATL